MRAAIALLLVLGAVLASARPAAASCIYLTAEQQYALADVVFDGVLIEGPNESGFERFQVIRYLKPQGISRPVEAVLTGRRTHPGGISSVTSVSIDARVGELWRIYAQRQANGALTTSVCLGSARLAAPGEFPVSPPYPAQPPNASVTVRIGTALRHYTLVPTYQSYVSPEPVSIPDLPVLPPGVMPMPPIREPAPARPRLRKLVVPRSGALLTIALGYVPERMRANLGRVTVTNRQAGELVWRIRARRSSRATLVVSDAMRNVLTYSFRVVVRRA